MAVAHIKVPPGPPAAAPVDVQPSVVVLGRPTRTNRLLAEAFSPLGYGGFVADPSAPPRVEHDDLVLARLDVLPTLDGVEEGLWRLPSLARRGARVLNGSVPLLAAHDKLLTALLLGRVGIAQPRTTHVCGVSVPAFPPPYAVKPRFGSWGRDVYRCGTAAELIALLEQLRERRWFRSHGALVQELVASDGHDLRVLVAGGRVVGAIERIAAPGEWRTNVALGGFRLRATPSPSARVLALRAVAALGLDFAGVDLLADRAGRQRVLEVNGAVDFTGDYGDDVFAALLDAVPSAHSYQRLSVSSLRS